MGLYRCGGGGNTTTYTKVYDKQGTSAGTIYTADKDGIYIAIVPYITRNYNVANYITTTGAVIVYGDVITPNGHASGTSINSAALLIIADLKAGDTFSSDDEHTFIAVQIWRAE